jgi:adenylate cyclase
MRVNRKCSLPSLGLGLLIGLLGALICLHPATSGWEEGTGLGLLFKLRGRRPVPPEVAIVSINGDTGAQLGLGEEIPKWPRALHAQLIDRLHKAGAAVVAFDIFFKKPRDTAQDERLANAIARAGNILLVAYLERQRKTSGRQTLHIERLLPPLDILRAAAAGVAPFVLPKVPVRVSRFWTFSGETALPTMPVLALQQLADPDGSLLDRLLGANAGRSDQTSRNNKAPSLAQRLHDDPQLREQLEDRLRAAGPASPLNQRQSAHLQALLNLCDGDNYPYLNFYGPPSSIPIIPYQRLLNDNSKQLQRLKGKVVFVGYVGDYQPKQRDGFYTVFSQDNGLDLSGVEIAATAFANLLHGETLTPLGPVSLITLLVAYSLAVTLLLRHLPGSSGIIATLLLAAVYLNLVYLLFARHEIWLPWFVPLLLQTPLAMILVLSWHYRQMRLSREHLRELFGYYLPGDVIDRLAQDKERTMEQSDKAFGVCLASDARQYTSLAEHMAPNALQAFLNRYYEILFAPVRSRGGVVSDVIGDAMLAIWPAARPNAGLRQRACEAALHISRNLETSQLEPRLHTGIGLHAGELVMSHVGAIDHFEYRAVGDMVNTATRIEEINKLLGTTILASEDVLVGLQGILTRELGAFWVAGKQQHIVLHEIAAFEAEASPALRALHKAFAEALAEWQQGDRNRACAHFEAILQQHPDDGPSAYYVQQHHERRRNRINPLPGGQRAPNPLS